MSMKPGASIVASDQAAERVAVAPRVTLDSIKSKILHEQFITSADIDAATDIYPKDSGVLTLCILTMANGFQVVGKSACAAPANFNAELGRQFAYDDAFDQIWALEGYALRTAMR